MVLKVRRKMEDVEVVISVTCGLWLDVGWKIAVSNVDYLDT